MDPVLPYLYHQPEEDRPWHSFNGYSSSGGNTRLGSKILFDLNQGRSISLSPPVLCPATVTTDKHTQLTTAIRGPVFPRALTSGQASTTWIAQPNAQPFYTSLLGSPPNLVDNRRPLASKIEQCGVSVVYRTSYEPPTLTNSWTLREFHQIKD